MFIALLVCAAVFITVAIVLKNWIFGAIAVACIIIALLLGHNGKIGKTKPQVRYEGFCGAPSMARNATSI